MREKPGFPAYSRVSREACQTAGMAGWAGGIEPANGELEMTSWKSEALARPRETAEPLAAEVHK